MLGGGRCWLAVVSRCRRLWWTGVTWRHSHQFAWNHDRSTHWQLNCWAWRRWLDIGRRALCSGGSAVSSRRLAHFTQILHLCLQLTKQHNHYTINNHTLNPLKARGVNTWPSRSNLHVYCLISDIRTLLAPECLNVKKNKKCRFGTEHFKM